MLYGNGYGVSTRAFPHAANGSEKQPNKDQPMRSTVMGQMALQLELEKDYKQAAAWFSKAAKQNHPGALADLDTMAMGIGVPSNTARAIERTHRAAELGVAKSQYDLGLVYLNGAGCREKLSPRLPNGLPRLRNKTILKRC